MKSYALGLKDHQIGEINNLLRDVVDKRMTEFGCQRDQSMRARIGGPLEEYLKKNCLRVDHPEDLGNE